MYASTANDFQEENNNIATNSSRSDILALLTVLSADAESAVLLRVPSLSKVEARNFPLVHFPRCLCLVHEQLSVSLRCVKGRSYVNANISSIRSSRIVRYILSTTLPVTEIAPRRDSDKCQLLRLYSQFSFTKILKTLQVIIFTAFWRNVPRPS